MPKPEDDSKKKENMDRVAIPLPKASIKKAKPTKNTLEQKSAIKIQSFIRGWHLRLKLSVNSIDKDIIHIKIKGDASFFERLSITGIDASRGERQLDILSISALFFQGRVVGGEKLINIVSASDKDRETLLGPEKSVYINGGFYNSLCFYTDYQEHSTVGLTKTATHKPEDTIPIPKGYEDVYGILQFSDGSMLSSAPVLTKGSQIKFDIQLLSTLPYQFKTLLSENPPKRCPPGALFHASDPNPRAGITFSDPSKIEGHSALLEDPHTNRVRLTTGLATTRGPKSDGFTMHEWLNTLSRISRMNKARGNALNLDGGKSVVMGVSEKGKKIFEIAQDKSGRESSTFLAFKVKDKPTVPTEEDIKITNCL
jgi:hypothetical protein